MLVYLISSKEETERKSHIKHLEELFPGLIKIDAIYPSKIHIPFYNQIKAITKDRKGQALSDGSLGCLLSHRKIWKTILKETNNEYALILESDSDIVDINQIKKNYNYVMNNFDLFFWGAFDGRMKLYKSQKEILGNFQIGVPFIKSLYCTYGYMINKNAAIELLKQTSTFDYPIDYWKYRLKNTTIKVGGIIPNLITTKNNFSSTISNDKKTFFTTLYDSLIDLKNTIITEIK